MEMRPGSLQENDRKKMVEDYNEDISLCFFGLRSKVSLSESKQKVRFLLVDEIELHKN